MLGASETSRVSPPISQQMVNVVRRRSAAVLLEPLPPTPAGSLSTLRWRTWGWRSRRTRLFFPGQAWPRPRAISLMCTATEPQHPPM